MRGIASHLGTLVQAAAGNLICAAAWAQNAKPFAAPEAASSPPAGGVTGLGEVTFALAIVLMAIFGLAWMMRRVRGFGRRSSAALDVLAEVPLGPKERAVLIRVGKTQLLVGVTPQSVNALHVLEEPVSIEPPPVDATLGERPSFRTLLMRSLGKS
jgi:flagellar protein FliO/FliZ